MWRRGTILALAGASLLWLGFSVKALLLKYPPVLPDEALFANPAINLLRHGQLSTELLKGTLPGIGQRTYWMPPLYFLYLTIIFAFSGAQVVALKMASAAAALGVLTLTYFLGIHAGLGRWLSLLPVSLVAVDAVFLAGALTGRMDMLTLFLVLLALWFATRPSSGKFSLTYFFTAGLVCALPALTHPVGGVAPISVLIWWLLSPETRKWKYLLSFLAGICIAFLPWLAYVALDPHSFVAQFGGQLSRKSAAHTSLQSIADSFVTLFLPYASQQGRLIDIVLAAPLWFLGMVGLADFELHLRPKELLLRRSLLLLYGCQALTLLVILLGHEMWYSIYPIPIAAIGLCCLLSSTFSRRPLNNGRLLATSLILIWISAFVWSNLQHVSRLRQFYNVDFSSRTNYVRFCAEISEKIPAHSNVLLAMVPDCYFVLVERSDLTLHEFLPEKIPLGPGIYSSYMFQADYILSNPAVSLPTIEAFLQSNATLVDTIGSPKQGGYWVRIFRVQHQVR